MFCRVRTGWTWKWVSSPASSVMNTTVRPAIVVTALSGTATTVGPDSAASGVSRSIIATMASLVAAGMTLRQALPLANRAGGLVVGKFGTATVSYEELFA